MKSTTLFGSLTIPEISGESLTANYAAPAQLKSEEAKKMFANKEIENQSGVTLTPHFNQLSYFQDIE